MKKQRSGFGVFAAAFFVSLALLLLTMGTVLSVTIRTDETPSQTSTDLSARSYTPSPEDAFCILVITESGGGNGFSLLVMDPMAVEIRLITLPGELAGPDGRTLLAALDYAGGGEVLAELSTMDIHVDRWIRLSRAGAVNIIDAFGGMEWEFSEPLRSDRLDIPVGRHLLDGETVLTLMEEEDRRLPAVSEMAASLIGQRLTEQLLNRGDWFFQVLTANSDGNISQFDYQSHKKMLRWYLTHDRRSLTAHRVEGRLSDGKLQLTDGEKALLG